MQKIIFRDPITCLPPYIRQQFFPLDCSHSYIISSLKINNAFYNFGLYPTHYDNKHSLLKVNCWGINYINFSCYKFSKMWLRGKIESFWILKISLFGNTSEDSESINTFYIEYENLYKDSRLLQDLRKDVSIRYFCGPRVENL